MRASVIKEDPGFANFRPPMRVFINGIEHGYVVTADEEKRCALVRQLNEHGRPFVRDGEVATEWVYGDVRIEAIRAQPLASFAAGGIVHDAGKRHVVGEQPSEAVRWPR